jgi:hypothetical protein
MKRIETEHNVIKYKDRYFYPLATFIYEGWGNYKIHLVQEEDTYCLFFKTPNSAIEKVTNLSKACLDIIYNVICEIETNNKQPQNNE